jgi:SAM-dependent methyltransferase
MTLPLTKTLRCPYDFGYLAPELQVVDAVGIGEQHPMRRWEYAMALHALRLHQQGYTSPLDGYRVLDVGGAGSTFGRMCVPDDGTGTIRQYELVDPRENETIEARQADYLADAVISISTIEHVKDPLPFLQACHRALAPGGLFFLTMDAWDKEGPDTAHFHWMRERIYDQYSWPDLAVTCRKLGFRGFGGFDPAYHGDHVYDYTFASLALTKEI